MAKNPQEFFFQGQTAKNSSSMRLQVYVARYGEYSRRKAFDIVRQGAVSVDGVIEYEPSRPVTPGEDRVCVYQRSLKAEAYVYLMLNKPRGYVTTRADRHAKQTVYALIPSKYRHLSPVGRLDKDTEGLLLLTNDGALAYQLTHPKFNVDKLYAVCVQGALCAKTRKKIEQGFVLDAKKTAPAQMKAMRVLKETTAFQLKIHEGRKRQIRLMMAHWGHRVLSLKRLRQGPVKLGALRIGAWRLLSGEEVKSLYQVASGEKRR